MKTKEKELQKIVREFVIEQIENVVQENLNNATSGDITSAVVDAIINGAIPHVAINYNKNKYKN